MTTLAVILLIYLPLSTVGLCEQDFSLDLGALLPGGELKIICGGCLIGPF